MKLNGISIGYENNLIYKCNNQEALNEFKAYLDSSLSIVPGEVKIHGRQNPTDPGFL